MRRNQRVFGAVLAVLTVGAVTLAGRAGAAEPVVGLEGPTHVLTFTSPPVYDVSQHTSSSNGTITNETLIIQDQKGKFAVDIVDIG